MAKKEKTAAVTPEKTVREHSFATGNRLKRSRHNPGGVAGMSPLHAAADVAHGWRWHEFHYAAEDAFRCSEADYLAALKAAGTFKTHNAAMAPHWAEEAKKRATEVKQANERASR